MKIQCWLLTSVVALLSAQASAESFLNTTDIGASEFEYQIEERALGGFERLKMSGGMKVRGWQVGDRTHFGQTKVNDRWGIGFVFEKGNTSYGINHRGIQLNRKF